MTAKFVSHALRTTAALTALGASLALLPGGAHAAAGKPVLVERNIGGAQLFLRYTDAGGKPHRYTKLALTMKFETFETTFSKVRLKGPAGVSIGAAPTVTLRDVSGDGNRDGIVDVRTRGANGRSISSIALSTSMTRWNRPITVDWGKVGYALRDLGGDKRWEFVTADERFEAFADGEVVAQLPLLIKRGAKTKLIDTTAKFADRLRAEVDTLRLTLAAQAPSSPTALSDNEHRAATSRAVLAALVADLVRLGDVAGAKAAVEQVRARGDLSAAQAKDLGAKLKSWGYLCDSRTVGLAGPTS